MQARSVSLLDNKTSAEAEIVDLANKVALKLLTTILEKDDCPTFDEVRSSVACKQAAIRKLTEERMVTKDLDLEGLDPTEVEEMGAQLMELANHSAEMTSLRNEIATLKAKLASAKGRPRDDDDE